MEEIDHRTVSKVNNDTGFGSAPNYGGRFINKDGTINVQRDGNFFQRFSLFNWMLTLPLWQFIFILFFFYFGVNVIFTALYFMLGIEYLQGLIGTTKWEIITEVYFFSTQTFTTVGYGRVNPVGSATDFLASLEAMIGVISFAIVTGLLYGRFSKPTSFLVFSDDALISPYKDGHGLMFRFASRKDDHILTDVVIKVNLSLQVINNGVLSYQFYDLALERNRVDSLPMNWTVVHPLNEDSPLYNLSKAELVKRDVEIYVLVKGFDDVYSNTVLHRTSYTANEILFDRKYGLMYRESRDAMTTIVDIRKINNHTPLNTSDR
jgi:inward rectifier potassium channel